LYAAGSKEKSKDKGNSTKVIRRLVLPITLEKNGSNRSDKHGKQANGFSVNELMRKIDASINLARNICKLSQQQSKITDKSTKGPNKLLLLHLPALRKPNNDDEQGAESARENQENVSKKESRQITEEKRLGVQKPVRPTRQRIRKPIPQIELPAPTVENITNEKPAVRTATIPTQVIVEPNKNYVRKPKFYLMNNTTQTCEDKSTEIEETIETETRFAGEVIDVQERTSMTDSATETVENTADSNIFSQQTENTSADSGTQCSDIEFPEIKHAISDVEELYYQEFIDKDLSAQTLPTASILISRKSTQSHATEEMDNNSPEKTPSKRVRFHPDTMPADRLTEQLEKIPVFGDDRNISSNNLPNMTSTMTSMNNAVFIADDKEKINNDLLLTSILEAEATADVISNELRRSKLLLSAIENLTGFKY
jgi:hypothetical protein